MPFQPGKTVRFPKDTCAACPLRAALHHQQQRAQRVHPSRRGAAGRTAPAPADPGRAREAARTRRRSSTPSPTSGTGKAAAPATAAPARTCSTCAASPSSTTSTSSPASPPPTVTSWPPDGYLTGALAATGVGQVSKPGGRALLLTATPGVCRSAQGHSFPLTSHEALQEAGHPEVRPLARSARPCPAYAKRLGVPSMLAARLPGNSKYDNPRAVRSGGCLIP